MSQTPFFKMFVYVTACYAVYLAFEVVQFWMAGQLLFAAVWAVFVVGLASTIGRAFKTRQEVRR
ncbi:hypothetical protein [Halomarina rubra]|uniref:Uncharacterized protein n=1 Tax=Halomarina rubra TaxID=2071873 RepID=A0ABD6AS53_9EURY|nr:hypothetical protein [Halomarina rubra]